MLFPFGKFFCTSHLQGLYKPWYAKTSLISNLLQSNLAGMKGGVWLSYPNGSWRTQPLLSTGNKAADRERKSLESGGGSKPVCKEDQKWKHLLHSRSHLAGGHRQPGFCRGRLGATDNFFKLFGWDWWQNELVYSLSPKYTWNNI